MEGIGAILGAVVGAAGVSFSQWVGGRQTLAAKRLELLYARRSIAYHTLLEAAQNYALDPEDAAYRRYLAASQNALILSSEEVARLLRSGGLSGSVSRIRSAETTEEAEAVKATDFYQAMEKLSDAMRRDLTSLSQ